MAKQRQAWLDYVRFFSIFLVIVFHTPPRLPLFDNAVILNLRVPVFFCISGFLYSIEKWGSFKQYAMHRSKQILVPYITFFIIFYTLWLVVGRRLGGPSEQSIPVLTPVWEFLLGDPKVVLAPFWYIACLYTMQLLYYWVERLVPRRWVFAACLGLALCTFALLEMEHSRPAFEWWRVWNVSNALLFMPFYALGNNFKRQLSGLKLSSFKVLLLCLVLAAASMAGMVLVAPLEGTDYPLYMLARIPAGFMVIPAYFGIAKWLADRYGRIKTIEFVTVSGTVYLGMQNYFIVAGKLLLNHLFYDGVIDDHVWLKFLLALVVMVAIYPVAWFIDRYTPWLIGKGKLFEKY